jgi:hypothetical protein
MLTGFVAEAFGVWVSIFANGALCCVGMAIALVYVRRSRNRTVFDLGQAAHSPARDAAE